MPIFGPGQAGEPIDSESEPSVLFEKFEDSLDEGYVPRVSLDDIIKFEIYNQFERVSFVYA